MVISFITPSDNKRSNKGYNLFFWDFLNWDLWGVIGAAKDAEEGKSGNKTIDDGKTVSTVVEVGQEVGVVIAGKKEGEGGGASDEFEDTKPLSERVKKAGSTRWLFNSDYFFSWNFFGRVLAKGDFLYDDFFLNWRLLWAFFVGLCKEQLLDSKQETDCAERGVYDRHGGYVFFIKESQDSSGCLNSADGKQRKFAKFKASRSLSSNSFVSRSDVIDAEFKSGVTGWE